MRTVQLWFQSDNQKGASSDNINWLAHIFGCGDPEAVRVWRIKLMQAQSVLSAKRKETSDDQYENNADKALSESSVQRSIFDLAGLTKTA